MSQLALFETVPVADVTHVLMPSMRYACGESMLDVGGHFTVGLSNWARIDCSGCLALGAGEIQLEIHREQRAQA